MIRLKGVYDPNNETVHVIGCGATGSNLAYQLVKSGVPNINLYDFDVVENLNICNQFYKFNDTGQLKSVALKKELSRWQQSNQKIFVRKKSVPLVAEDLRYISGTVFYCLDKIAARRKLYQYLPENPNVELLIDIRMGVDGGRISFHCPCVPFQRKWYTTTFYTIENSEAACFKNSVGVVASALGNYAIALWYQYLKQKEYPQTIFFDVFKGKSFRVNWSEAI